MNLLFKLFGGSYDDLWKAIIRPNRDEYSLEELGPFKFEFKGKCYKRTDLELINKRSQKMVCSFWEPFDEERESPKLPCVIYLHGNSSSRCEAYPEVKYLLQRNITVFSFDFCGCGKSEGEYITLGYNEKKDVHCVVEYLLKSRKISKIGIWGRSMGAVTALMYANEHPKLIDVMVLDSGFYSLNKLIKELIESKINLPNLIYDKVLNMVKETVKEKAKFDMDIIEPYIFARNCLIPAFFCHGSEDNFVFPHHCVDLFNDYKGSDKSCEIVKGYHNSARPKELRIKICDFLLKYLKEDDLDSNDTINNSITYERVGVDNNFLNFENDNKYMSHSLNIVDLKSKFAEKKNLKHFQSNNKLNIKELKNELNPANVMNFSINDEKKVRTYSHNKVSKNNLNLVPRKNKTNNSLIKKLKIKDSSKNKLKNEENASSTNSSIIEEKPIYKKKNIKKNPFNQLKAKGISISHFFNNNTKSKKNINKPPLPSMINKKSKVINLNRNKKSLNNHTRHNNNTPSFLNNVVRKAPNLKNNRLIYNSLLRHNIIRHSPQSKIIGNNKENRIYTETFFSTTNIIQNNYYTTNNIIVNQNIPVRSKKSASKYNGSYSSSKKQTYKYQTKKTNKSKNYFTKECKKNLLIKTFDAQKEKKINLLNKYNNYTKNIKLYSKVPISSNENTIQNDNEEVIGRNLP